VPLKAQILAARPGHASNVEFAKKVRKLYQQKKIIKKYQHVKKEGTVFDVNALQRILPHRYPFLLVDKIIDFQLNEKFRCEECDVRRSIFPGTFSRRPRHARRVDSRGSCTNGRILLLDGSDRQEGKLVMFMAINNAKFRKPVVPGDQLVYEVTMMYRKAKVCQVMGKAYVDGALVAEAEMIASIVDRPGAL